MQSVKDKANNGVISIHAPREGGDVIQHGQSLQ